MYGSGIYHLAPGYGHYLIPTAMWSSKSREQKDKLFKDFLFDTKRKSNPKTLKARGVIALKSPMNRNWQRKQARRGKEQKPLKDIFKWKIFCMFISFGFTAYLPSQQLGSYQDNFSEDVMCCIIESTKLTTKTYMHVIFFPMQAQTSKAVNLYPVGQFDLAFRASVGGGMKEICL